MDRERADTRAELKPSKLEIITSDMMKEELLMTISSPGIPVLGIGDGRSLHLVISEHTMIALTFNVKHESLIAHAGKVSQVNYDISEM